MKFFNIPEGPTVCQANGSGKIFCRQIGLLKIVKKQHQKFNEHLLIYLDDKIDKT